MDFNVAVITDRSFETRLKMQSTVEISATKFSRVKTAALYSQVEKLMIYKLDKCNKA